jgi:hypothetical protein
MPQRLSIQAEPLQFSEYLKRLPPALVFKHLVSKGLTERKILSSVLVNEVCEKFLHPDQLSRRFAGLSPDGQVWCSLIYLCGRSGIGSGVPQALHLELVSSFLVYTAHDSNEFTYYLGFEDCGDVLREPMAGALADYARKALKLEPSRFYRWRCVNDLAVLLSVALQGQLQRTQKGTLVRASAQLLRRLFHATAQTCVFETEEKDFECIIELLLAYAVQAGLLLEEEKNYTATHERVREWTALTPGQQWDDLLEFCTEYIGEWRLEMFDAMREKLGGDWLDVRALTGRAGTTQVGAALLLLHYLGYADAVNDKGGVYWRLAQREAEEAGGGQAPGAGVIISADFSVVLTQEVSSHTLYCFSLLGTFSNFDCIYRANIDRETVNNSLSSGIPGDELLTYLMQWHAPENVTITVAEWIREFSRLYVTQTAIIAAFDEKTTLQIQSYKPLQGLIEPIPSHAVFAIREGKERQVREMLLAMGYDIRFPQKTAVRDEEENLAAPVQPSASLAPVYDFVLPEKEEEQTIKAGKYSAELKALELSELLHVLDYAMLMGHTVTFDYAGSQYIRKGEYTIRPLAMRKTNDPLLEGMVVPGNKSKTFFIKKILKIGVNAA